MRVRIIVGFSVDEPKREHFPVGSVLDHPDGALWVKKGLAEAADGGSAVPAADAQPVDPDTTPWPALRDSVEAVTGTRPRSRREAKAVLAEASEPSDSPDAAE
tara:strand:+ start:115 stop:423 length:309 start_codon:yes stop_codon:yes gene_type:complete